MNVLTFSVQRRISDREREGKCRGSDRNLFLSKALGRSTDNRFILQHILTPLSPSQYHPPTSKTDTGRDEIRYLIRNVYISHGSR
ncbi:hypothetical protein KCU95_g106, partial [Aureobasidium melanogenum]